MNKYTDLSSKTTLNGYLALYVSICTSLLAVPQYISPKVIAILIVSGGIAKAIVGVNSQDADKQLAITPDGTIKTVPSHTDPNNPADIPIVPEPPK